MPTPSPARAFADSWILGDLIDEESGFTRDDLDELIRKAEMDVKYKPVEKPE